MRKNLDNSAYIHHISDSIQEIINYTSNHTYSQFLKNDWDQAALMRYLEVIGEAANKLEERFRMKNPHIKWRKIIDLRNILIHDYMDVDVHIMWNIMIGDIPELKQKIDKIMLVNQRTQDNA